MKATNFLTALILILAISACTIIDTPEQPASNSTPVMALEQAADDSTPVDTPERSSSTTSPVDTPEPAAATTSPVDTPEPATATSVPLDTPEPLSDRDTAQLYAAAIYQIYNVDHSFADPPGFPFVYVATITADGAMLDLPVTPPQKLQPDLLSAIEDELADRPYELLWVGSLDDVPVDDSNGQVAGGQGIYITLGNLYPQDDGTVQLPIFMLCGGLCALGKTYVLSEVDGAWQVTGSVGMEIMA